MEDRITLRLPQELRRQIRVAAAEADQSMNAWIVEAIREKLQRRHFMRTIKDENGRKGIVSEQRDNGVFARPEGAPAFIESGPIVGIEGKAMTDTFWSFKPDGSLRGLWFDSRLNGFVTAYLQD